MDNVVLWLVAVHTLLLIFPTVQVRCIPPQTLCHLYFCNTSSLCWPILTRCYRCNWKWFLQQRGTKKIILLTYGDGSIPIEIYNWSTETTAVLVSVKLVYVLQVTPDKAGQIPKDLHSPRQYLCALLKQDGLHARLPINNAKKHWKVSIPKNNYSGTIYSFGGRDRGNTQYYFNAYNYFMMQFAYNTHTVIIYIAIGERKHVHVSRWRRLLIHLCRWPTLVQGLEPQLPRGSTCPASRAYLAKAVKQWKPLTASSQQSFTKSHAYQQWA